MTELTMTITKYLHSCLLIEEDNKTILLDPGQYTYEAKVLDLGKLNKLDYLIITHEHFDHFFLPFVKEFVAKFPQVKIISNQSVVDLLQKENIHASYTGNDFVQTEEVPHEKLFDKAPPPNVKFTLFSKLTHPGDSFHFDTTTDILAMPIQAPWGSLVQAVEKIMELKPKVVIPIHDWHWKDDVRKGFYERLTEYFKPQGIELKGLETGEMIQVT